MARFMSPIRNLRIVVESTKTLIVDGETVKQPGVYIRFRNGRYRTENEEHIELLRNHPDVMELGPTINEVLEGTVDEVADFINGVDSIGVLQQFYNFEKEGQNRKGIAKVIRARIDQILDMENDENEPE